MSEFKGVVGVVVGAVDTAIWAQRQLEVALLKDLAPPVDGRYRHHRMMILLSTSSLAVLAFFARRRELVHGRRWKPG